MNVSGRLLALFAAIALGATAASAKHIGGSQTNDTPPIANTTNESELSTGRGYSLVSTYPYEFGPSLGTPLEVYTKALSARVALSTLDLRSLDLVQDTCAASKEIAMKVLANRVSYKPIDYIKYSDVPEMLLKYFLVKATWKEAQETCADDGAVLYTSDHSVQLDSTMANFYPLLCPWVDVQKARVAGGSMMCGYLHQPASGKSSLRWDDCNTKREFICQKQGFTALTKISLSFPVVIKPISKTIHLSIATYLTAFVAQSQTIVIFLLPLIRAAANQSLLLNPVQVGQIETLMTQWQTFNFVLMPEINTLVSTTPDLSSAQIHEIHEAAEQGITLYTNTQAIVDLFLTQLNLNAAQQQTTNLAPMAKRFYSIIACVFSHKRPLLTHEHALKMQDIIKQSQTLIDGTIDAFHVFTTTTTTSTITTLAQVLQTILDQVYTTFNVLIPISNVNTALLTPTDVAQVQAILLENQSLLGVTFPNIISMLTTNPTLSPEQLRQLQSALAQAILFGSSIQWLASTLGPKLNLNLAQQQAIIDIMGIYLKMFGLITQATVSDSNYQLIIGEAQLFQLQGLLESVNDVISAAPDTLTTNTTPSTTPSMTTSEHGEHHHHHHHHLELSQEEREDILSHIQESVADSVELLHFLHSLSAVGTRTTIAQRNRHKELINKVHSLHTHQTEIEARLREMFVHDHEATGSKLVEDQGHLNKLNTDRPALTQTLTMASDNQQLLHGRESELENRPPKKVAAKPKAEKRKATLTFPGFECHFGYCVKKLRRAVEHPSTLACADDVSQGFSSSATDGDTSPVSDSDEDRPASEISDSDEEEEKEIEVITINNDSSEEDDKEEQPEEERVVEVIEIEDPPEVEIVYEQIGL